MQDLSYRLESTKSFDEISRLLEKTSPERGFRVLAIHDTKATLAEKGFQIEPLKIFEVCNAGFAFKALGKNVDVSLFMPCKIVVRAEKGKTVMTLARPLMISAMLPGFGLEELAGEVEKQLIGIMNEIK
ncbi:conserved hypothetical protein [Candidatus Zixiibacteriota bacterium]|nr:conserved hypothetical protein [candidate division Zixibacteria bacterium]